MHGNSGELEIEGIFTHLPGLMKRIRRRQRQQLEQFLDFTGRIRRELGIHIPVQHCSNSAGIVGLGENKPGCGQGRNHPLRPVAPSEQVSKGYRSFRAGALLKSRIVYMKELEAGRAVSYARPFVTQAPPG